MISSFHLICYMSRLIIKQPNCKRKRITRCVNGDEITVFYPSATGGHVVQVKRNFQLGGNILCFAC